MFLWLNIWISTIYNNHKTIKTIISISYIKLHQKMEFCRRMKIRFWQKISKNLRNFPGFWVRKRAENAEKCEKNNFSSRVKYWYSIQYKKSKKNLKKYVAWYVCNEKKLFLQPQTTTIRDGMREGVVNRGMFIERMKECSKYSRRGIWDSQAMRPGQTKKEKRH